MEFRNYTEELVTEILGDILNDSRDFCSCERCGLDTKPPDYFDAVK